MVAGTVVASLAVAFVGGYEGLRTKAYRDIIGVPTVCYGETRGVKMSDSFSKEECDAMLIQGLRDFEGEVTRCAPALVHTPPSMFVAHVSLAYNIGSHAYCGSTLARKFNAGDWAGACGQFVRWNRAGGRVIRGLTRRREAEAELCRRDLKPKKAV
jgi:lysozyme